MKSSGGDRECCLFEEMTVYQGSKYILKLADLFYDSNWAGHFISYLRERREKGAWVRLSFPVLICALTSWSCAENGDN